MKNRQIVSAALASALVFQSFGSASAAAVIQSGPRAIPVSGGFSAQGGVSHAAPMSASLLGFGLSPLSLTPGVSLTAPAPTTIPSGVVGVSPLVSAAIPSAVPSLLAVPQAPLDKPVVAASAQLEEAKLTLSAPSAQGGSDQQETGASLGSRWHAFWSKAPRAKADADVEVSGKTSAPAPLVKPSPVKAADKKSVPTPLRGIAAAGLAFVLPSWIPALIASAAPFMTMLGTATGLVLTFRAADAGIEKLAAKFGWGPKTAMVLKFLSRAGMVAGFISLPAALPAIWAGAIPYAAGGGFLAAAWGLDKLVQKGVEKLASAYGWSEKTKGWVMAVSRAATWTLGGGLGLEAAGIPVAGIVASIYGMVSPYTAVAGTLLGTFAVNRVVRWGVDRFAEKAGWQPNTKVAVRLIAGIIVWTSGIGLGLASAGVSTMGLMTTFGVGGIAVTMAAKDFIGNFIEGIKVLLNHPFLVGDKIKIGDKEYVVKDMGLRYLQLEKEPGTTTLMTYTQLADKTITIFREYTAKHDIKLKKPTLGFMDFIRMAKPDARPDMKRAAVWTAVGVGLVLALPALSAWAALPWLAAALPYLQGGAVLFVSRSVARWLTGTVVRLSELAGWDKQVTTVLKLAAQAAAYAIGGTIALRTFGVDWSTLLASLGATSIAVGWASADIIGNLIQGFQILMSQPFKIGDTIEVGAVKGAVIDMNMQYVVLEHADKSHTLVPYAVIKASAFTVAEKEEKK